VNRKACPEYVPRFEDKDRLRGQYGRRMSATTPLTRWLRVAVSGCTVVPAAAWAIGCGTEANNLSASDIRSELQKLPFDYQFRNVNYSGDGAVVAGLARDRGHATYFAVIEGEPKISGRVVPRQRLPNGGFQKGVNTTFGPGYVTKFVYTPTSTSRASSEIDFAMCVAARGDRKSCVD
jgi:hypothetical protein